MKSFNYTNNERKYKERYTESKKIPKLHMIGTADKNFSRKSSD
jgi:hypothetical protein